MCFRVMIIVVVLLAVLQFNSRCKASVIPCSPCIPPSCIPPPPESCPFGETRDACDNRICAKGPGERCGGPGNVMGDCGEGLMCKADEKCHGCSIDTLQCYTTFN